jgi:hypothetical protein
MGFDHQSKKYSVLNLARYGVSMLEFQIQDKYWEQKARYFRQIYNLVWQERLRIFSPLELIELHSSSLYNNLEK